MINRNMTIKDAAREVDIKYENAKAIYRVYRKEQRTEKRRNRLRFKPDQGDTFAKRSKQRSQRGGAGGVLTSKRAKNFKLTQQKNQGKVGLVRGDKSSEEFDDDSVMDDEEEEPEDEDDNDDSSSQDDVSANSLVLA